MDISWWHFNYQKSSSFHPMIRDKLGHIISNVIRQDNNNSFSLGQVLCHLQSGKNIRATTAANQQAFVLDKFSGRFERVVVVYLNPLIHNVQVHSCWNEVISKILKLLSRLSFYKNQYLCLSSFETKSQYGSYFKLQITRFLQLRRNEIERSRVRQRFWQGYFLLDQHLWFECLDSFLLISLRFQTLCLLYQRQSLHNQVFPRTVSKFHFLFGRNVPEDSQDSCTKIKKYKSFRETKLNHEIEF